MIMRERDWYTAAVRRVVFVGGRARWGWLGRLFGIIETEFGGYDCSSLFAG